MENAQEGDAAAASSDAESRKTRIRSADGEDEEAVPTKVMKMTDGALANQEVEGAISANQNDSDLDLGDEEDYEEGADQGVELKDAEGDDDEEPLDLDGDYTGESDQPGEDFEEVDAYDEEEDELATTADETEDNIGEEADSSTELQDYVQANLAYIEDCQSDIDSLNHKANEEILLVELKYNKLRLPVYKRRNTYIERVPHFWATVFSQHRQLRQVLTKEDIKCLKHVVKLQVEDFEDNRSGYSIQFFFSQNPWFENKVITKEYHLPWHGSPSCSCTPIQWKKGMNLTLKSSSFFSWFTRQEDASADDIAEIIKDDLWPNPLQCFLMSNKQADESDGEEADDSGNLNSKDDSIVLLDDTRDDDDDVEYISSDEEEDQEWQGGRGPATSAQYMIQEDEDDEDEYEGLDEEDEEEEVDTIGSSSMLQQQQMRKEQERRPKTDEVINIDDDYLGSEEEEDAEYLRGPVDLIGEEKLLQGQAEEEFAEAESSKEPGGSPKNPVEDRLTGEVQQSDDSNHDSRHSNGVAGPSEGEQDGPDPPNSSELKSKMQESKVVDTPTTVDSDVLAGGT